MRSARLRTPRRAARLEIEVLESRLVPYALTGTAWPSPELITIGFVPDGTDLGGVSSNLVSNFNSRFGSQSAWQNAILKAAQVWAQYTNLNFALVPDGGAPIGSGEYLQGAEALADIRIGGFNFGRGTLGQAYLPPPVNNFSLAGDTQFNTGQTWVLGTTGGYDLFTVAMHEIGHALGLGHSSNFHSVMYPSYTGARAGLGADDISGIRALYSAGLARTHDLFDVVAPNNGVSTASYLDVIIDPRFGTALVTNLDITTKTDVDYFAFGAPATTDGSLTVMIQSAGLSLLMPSVGLYNEQFKLLGFATGLGQYGSTLTMTVNGVTPGERFYLGVVGADDSAFGIGRYALSLNFGSGPSPTVPLPDTRALIGTPLASGTALSEVDEHNHEHEHEHHGGAADVVVLARAATPVRAIHRLTPAADGNLIAALTRAASAVPADGESTFRASGTAFIDPVPEPRLLVPFQSRFEGGAYEDAEEFVRVEEEHVPPPVDEMSSPLPALRSEVELTPEQVRESSDTCFVDAAWDLGHLLDEAGPLSPSDDEIDGGYLPLDPLAAAACLAVVFGGHWASPREEERRQRGQF